MAVQAPRCIGILMTFASLTACVGAGDNSSAANTSSVDDFAFTEMLSNYTDNIFIPAAETFNLSASALNNAAVDYCETALDSNSEESAVVEKLSTTQEAWRNSMAAWQVNEMTIVGPLTEQDNQLRNRILSYGTIFKHNAGAVDAAVDAAAEDLSSRRNNALGLDAVEYLLFTTFDNTNENLTKRCKYLKLLTADVVDSSNTLTSSWQEDRSAFLSTANVSSSLGGVSDALFYIEEVVKDRKIGIPSSIIQNNGCTNAGCPEDVESPYSETSFANVKVNLLTLKRLLTGDSGLGFDDLIAANPTFADRGIITDLIRDIDAAITYIDLIDNTPPLIKQAQEQLRDDDETLCTNAASSQDGEPTMCSLYGKLKLITDRLRIEFIAAVDLDLPERSQSDND